MRCVAKYIRSTIVIILSCFLAISQATVTPVIEVRPVIEVPPQNQKFIKFSNVSFLCIASGHPRPEIKWVKNRTTIRSNNKKFSIKHQRLGDCVIKCDLSSKLWVLDTIESDTGTYTCRASNIAGHVTRTAQLTIEHNANNAHKVKIIVWSCGGGGIIVIIIIITVACIMYCRHRRRRGEDNGERNADEQDRLVRLSDEHRIYSIQ